MTLYDSAEIGDRQVVTLSPTSFCPVSAYYARLSHIYSAWLCGLIQIFSLNRFVPAVQGVGPAHFVLALKIDIHSFHTSSAAYSDKQF